jgi:alpha-1,6-mannosyltransferase
MEPSQYGPLWVLLGDALAALGQTNLFTEVVLYKLVAALAHLASAALVLSICNQIGATACQAKTSAYLLLWNPLLLWEMVGNAHNDGVMMLGGLAAVWLLAQNRNVLVLPALMLGALVKLPVVVLAPLISLTLWHRKKAAAIEGFWLALLLAVVVYRPFWEGAATLTALRRTDLFTASLGSVLRLSLTPELGLEGAANIARAISLGGFGILVGLTLLRAVRPRPLMEVVTLAYLTMLAAALLATTWFQAWYLVWPLALASPLPEGRRHLEAALLSLGGFLQYFVFIYLWVIGVFPPVESLALQLAAFLGIIGPPVLGVVLWRYAPLTTHSKEIVGAD